MVKPSPMPVSRAMEQTYDSYSKTKKTEVTIIKKIIRSSVLESPGNAVKSITLRARAKIVVAFGFEFMTAVHSVMSEPSVRK